MPRVRSDNDARYALRASFVDENGDVITGDTILIPGSFDEVDTLDSVTGRGNTTSNSVTIGGLTVNGVATATDGFRSAQSFANSQFASGTNPKTRFGRDLTAQYLTLGGNSSGNIIASVSSASNPKGSVYISASKDGGATAASVWTFSDGSGGTVVTSANISSYVSGGVLELGNGGGQYGSVNTPNTNPATGGYYGYSIGGRAVFMHNGGTSTGIYNDVNNQWIIKGTHNADTFIYHAGVAKGYTYSGGWRVAGNLLATGDVYAYYSDKRLKDVSGPLTGALEKISTLHGVYYTHNEKARELGYEGSERQVGLIAQEVQAVLPEVIGRAPADDDGEGGSVTGEDYITVNYARIVPLLVEAIKELKEEVEELKRERNN